MRGRKRAYVRRSASSLVGFEGAADGAHDTRVEDLRHLANRANARCRSVGRRASRGDRKEDG